MLSIPMKAGFVPALEGAELVWSGTASKVALSSLGGPGLYLVKRGNANLYSAIWITPDLKPTMGTLSKSWAWPDGSNSQIEIMHAEHDGVDLYNRETTYHRTSDIITETRVTYNGVSEIWRAG